MSSEYVLNRRNSSVELLRIISILMIISMHTLECYASVDNIYIKGFALLANSIANSGVTIFVLISGFYGIRFRIEKLFSLLNVVWFYSILSSVILFVKEEDVSYAMIASSVFPVLTCKYWFVTSYILLYVFSSYLNRLSDSLKQREYQILLVLLLLFFVFAPTFLKIEILHDGGKGPINMLLIYLLGRYFNRFGFPSILKKQYLYLALFSAIIIFIANSLITCYTGRLCYLFARDNNVFILILAVSFFYPFVSRCFYCSVINDVAKFTLSVYLLQGIFVRMLPEIIDPVHIIIVMLASPLVIYLICLVVDYCRQFLLKSIFENTLKLECGMLCMYSNLQAKK